MCALPRFRWAWCREMACSVGDLSVPCPCGNRTLPCQVCRGYYVRAESREEEDVEVKGPELEMCLVGLLADSLTGWLCCGRLRRRPLRLGRICCAACLTACLTTCLTATLGPFWQPHHSPCSTGDGQRYAQGRF